MADIYGIGKDEFLSLDRMGDKLATKIMDNIQSSRLRPFPRVVFALGILHVGSETAELLVQHFPDIWSMAGASEEELIAIPGIGPKIAASVSAYFNVGDNREVIEKLALAGVNLASGTPPSGDASLHLRGQTFSLTGTLSSMHRSQAETLIRSMGGLILSSVTQKTSCLVVGTDPGSKLEKARRLGIPIITEVQLLELLRPQDMGK